MGIPEKIKAVEDELQKIRLNKSTEHAAGLLKAKLAKLKREEETSHGGGGSHSYAVKRSGDATVTFIGLPSVGKSTIMNRLTNAKSKTAAYHFTTRTVVPGMMDYKGAHIQILDLPGIIKGASSGRGLGKRVLSVVRSSDLILFTLEVLQSDALPVLINELRNIGIRPDEKPPRVTIEKSNSGGVSVYSSVPLTKIDVETVKKVLQVYDIINARVMINEDVSYDQLIDVLLGNRKYVPSVVIMNKIDLVSAQTLKGFKSKLDFDYIPISAEANINIDLLKGTIYQKLDFIRIYMRPRGGETDYEEPMIMRNSASVLDVCNKIHRDMKHALRYAQISGKSVKFNGQKVGATHRLMSEDVITLVTK
jgi:ribosome-interacting GTPase 1